MRTVIEKKKKKKKKVEKTRAPLERIGLGEVRRGSEAATSDQANNTQLWVLPCGLKERGKRQQSWAQSSQQHPVSISYNTAFFWIL